MISHGFARFIRWPAKRHADLAGDKMMVRKKFLSAVILCAAACALPTIAQQAQTAKPLTNLDVTRMVKAGLPESVVLQTIQSSPGKYDVSPNGLISLQKAGVTQNEMNAMLAVANAPGGSGGGAPGAAAGASSAAATPPRAAAAAAPPPSQPAANSPPPSAPATPAAMHVPKVQISDGTNFQDLPADKTQLAQTKNKPSSMKNLAADSTVGQSVQAGVNTAAMEASAHTNSMGGSAAESQAGNVYGSIMAHRKPSVTYVWAVPGPASASVVPFRTPSFIVDFSDVMGANPDDYEPAIVKLTPSQNSFRVVGATQGKADASSDPSADWQVYSSFMEERIQAQSQKIGRGKYRISTGYPMLTGEYAIVLRPISKGKKFSGGDVLRDQGDGMMFDTIFSFQIAQDAK
jgi:hypothetical protein